MDIELPNGTAIHFADEKAALFFVTDASAVGTNSYDAWVVSPNNLPNSFSRQDLRVINTTMRGRSSASHWETFTTETELESLKSVDPTWDLIETPDNAWHEADCATHIGDLLAELDGPYRRAAVVTKLLHLKRPRVIPICDSLVAAALGQSAWDATSTLTLVLAIRAVGQANLDALRTISSKLETIGIVRPLVRILDALLWFDSPSDGPRGPYGLFEDWLVSSHGGRLFF